MYSNLSKYERFIPAIAPKSVNELDPSLKIYSDTEIDIWYAPMGKPTSNPKIWILGITPGWNQMKLAYEDAAKAITSGLSSHQAAIAKKPKVAFAGSMRSNLITMLDDIGVNEISDVSSSINLFGSEILRTGSVLKYPVFKNSKNYTGHSPKPTKHKALREMLDAILADELETTNDCLIIPLGKSVEEVLTYFVGMKKLDPARVLFGFPHPSGANAHRASQFNERKIDF